MTQTTTKFWAAPSDRGIIVCAAETQPDRDFREVDDIHWHVSEKGMAQLLAGGTVEFTQADQSYPHLNRLFYQE